LELHQDKNKGVLEHGLTSIGPRENVGIARLEDTNTLIAELQSKGYKVFKKADLFRAQACLGVLRILHRIRPQEKKGVSGLLGH
jgi:hypothetical protein